MADRTIAIAFAPPLSFISIHTAALEWKTQRANSDGYASWVISDDLGDSDIRIEAEGYDTYQVHFKFKNNRDNAHDPQPLNQQVNVGTDIPALKPIHAPHNSITPVGRNFINSLGQRIVLRGCDLFCGYRQYLDGIGSAEIEQLVYNKTNCVRVFMQGSIKQNHVMELNPKITPDYYSKLRPFAEKINGYGAWLLAEVFVDNQDINLGLDHWKRVASELRGTQTILSGGNEWSKNGFDPQSLTNPDMIWTRGSDQTDKKTPPNGASCNSFHQRRNYPNYITDAAASPINIWESFGENVVLIDEDIKFNDVAKYDAAGHQEEEINDPYLAFGIASIYRAQVGLAVFHNYFSQRGLLLSPKMIECLQAWNEGLKI